ncbi:hypothetical protein HAX54_043075 [Datura stramonium]|uniref:Uncharacterized protein n=1 Tax=Datura stramonium TaxID=4076 RepID=A0ABS8SN31_DATST|nr:hypothetical protein [Datura stramonium]
MILNRVENITLEFGIDDDQLPSQISEIRITICSQTALDYAMPINVNVQLGLVKRSSYMIDLGPASSSAIVLDLILDKKHTFENASIFIPYDIKLVA